MSNNSVVFICDNGYVLPTLVAITSIKENYNKSRNLDIYVVCDGLNKENLSYFYGMSNDRISIKIVNADSSRYKGLEKEYSSVSRSALLKFSIPDLINCDYALYLDGDVIIRKDISDIFSIDLSDNYAAVVRDGPKSKVPGGKKHIFYAKRDYFNSGMMYLNLRKMRLEGASEKLITYRMQEYNYFMDQDAFNMVFGNKVQQLPEIYDFMLHLISYKNPRFSLPQLEAFYNSDHYDTIEALFADVKILHYTFDKPWKYYDIAFAEEWYKYFLMSPAKSIKLNRSSFLTDRIYNTKTYAFSRKLSKVIRFISFWRYK